ncbi:hypothetical protein AMAG_05182 [Allomyces macrogynus ATCC 38327]|uniref:BTB domain-containing protein n=1 Tax=Allomyces macrogynus (strain ATCC 38327) TaxID=578462 RepID=A0A0L0SAW6_ALLM3|nr:hypothetical protein AMAG_05182 [Allomyces macrogynus ATCC 38327]|eukprot:KNE59718.1 hypothetical protein AMAG_05182 [Allomyces macrogynus ATCC 38327]
MPPIERHKIIICSRYTNPASLKRFSTVPGSRMHQWRPAGQVYAHAVMRPSELQPTQDQLEKRPHLRFVEVEVMAWFSNALSNKVFDVAGTILYLDSGLAPDRLSYRFSMQLEAPPECPVISSDPPVPRPSVAATVVVAVDVSDPEQKVMDMELKFELAESEPTTLPHTPVALPSLGVLQYLHDTKASDCAFRIRGTETLLYASRIMLMRGSQFFRSMFSGNWTETQSKDPISFTSWDAPAVALAFVHIYSGWTPDQPTLPEDVPPNLVDDFGCDPDSFDEDAWRHLFKLARFLGLKPLARAVNRKLVALLEEQFQELSEVTDVLPAKATELAPARKRRRIETKTDDVARAS